MYYTIEHETHLHFQESVREHHCEVRLAPITDLWQRCHRLQIETEPASTLFAHTDYFGNIVHYFNVIPSHRSLVTRMSAEIETLLSNPFDFTLLAPNQEAAWVREQLKVTPSLYDYLLYRSPATPRLVTLEHQFTFPGYQPDKNLLDNVQSAMQWIRENFQYDTLVTDVHSTLFEVLESKAGVCQDFAHLLISLVRHWGFPARYVMGYQDPGYIAEGGEPQQATHAWAEVLIPGAGWRGFDPTHQLIADETYIRVAVGRDYLDAAPQRGSFKGEDPGSPPEVFVNITRKS